MKLFKALTTITLVFALFTLQVQHSKLVLNDALAQNTGYLDRNSERKKHSFTANHIMLWTSLAAAPSFVVACPTNASVLLFAAGAAALLVGEIATFAKFKDLSTSAVDMIAKYDKETANDQIELLEDAAEQEQRAADALGKKKTYTTIAATAYTAASILSFAESLNIMNVKPCVTGESGDGASQTTTPPATSYDKIPKFQLESIYASYLQNTDLGAHMAQVEDYQRFFNGEIRSLSVEEYKNIFEPVSHAVSPQESQLLTSALKMASSLFSLLIPNAHAAEGKKVGGSLGSAISAAVVSTVLTLIGPVRAMMSKLLSPAWLRGTTFAVFAGGAWGATAELSAGKKRLENNAQIYRDLAESLRISLDDRFAPKGPNTGKPNLRRPTPGQRDPNLPPLAEGSICLTGNLGERRVDAQCMCRKNNSCSKVDLANFNLGGYGLPSSFNNGLGTFGNGVNSLLSGNTVGADTAANAFGQNAARNLKGLLNAVKGKVSEKAAKEGKPVDLDKAEKALGKKILNDMDRVIGGLSQQQLAGMSAGSTGDLAEKVAEKIPESKQALASIKAPVPATSNSASGMDFNFDFGEEEPASEVVAGDINYEEALDGYVTDQNDISDRRNENIFNIITVRYFKSAYPRFFEEQKASLE